MAHFSFYFFPSFLAVLGARPSKHKIGNIYNINDNRRRKKAKAKSTVPSGMQVIDLVDDIQARSTILHSATSSAIPSAATLQNPLPTLIASPSSCLTQQVPSTPAIVSIATALVSELSSSPPTHQLEASSTSTHMPVHSNAPTPPPNSSNPLSSSPPPVQSNTMPPS